MARPKWKDEFPDPSSCAAKVDGEDKGRLLLLIERDPRVRSLLLFGCSGRDWSEVSQLCDLEHLAVNPWKHPSFEPLRALKSLRHLFLNVYGRVTDVSPLAELENLETLDINGLTYCRDISALCRLPKLRHFRFWGIPTAVTLESTSQFVGFTELETLDLGNERFRRGSIRDLAALRRLRQLHLANQYPLKDCAWLATRLPCTYCWLFSPTDHKGVECECCGRMGLQLMGAQRKHFACPRCEHERVARHIAAFERARRAAEGRA